MNSTVAKLIVLFAGLFLLFGAQASWAQDANIRQYHISLISKDLVFSNPTNTWSYWFNIRPGMSIPTPPRLSLHYKYSPTLLPGLGSISVNLNDVRISSHAVPDAVAGEHVFEVTLPVELIKKGFNQITLLSRQRSIEGECRDVDNQANWLKFLPSSSLILTIQRQSGNPLYLYPYPLLDELSAGAVQSTWYLPAKPTPAAVEAMLYTASDWGYRMPSRDMKIQVSTDSPAAYAGHQMLFGEAAAWAALGAPKLAKGVGWLGTLPTNAPDRPVRMLVAGDDSEGLQKASHLLAVDETVSQLEVQSAMVRVKPELRLNALQFCRGGITLAELGQQSLTIYGGFHQNSLITLQRPVRCNLGRKSYLEVHFHHSAALNSNHSQLAVMVNGLMIGSIRLTPGNVSNGVLTVPIPAEVLQKNSWNIGFSVFQDIGVIDCSKNYDNIAWTVIEGTTLFKFVDGTLPGRPYLEHFPYLIAKNGKMIQPVVMWLPAQPTAAQLTTAALIAARAGQENHQPIEWTVILGDTLPDLARRGPVAVIMIANLQDAKRCAAAKADLLIFPGGAKELTVNPKLNVFSDILWKAGVLQAVPLPTTPPEGSILYAVLARDDNVLKHLNVTLASREAMDNISDEVTLITPQMRIMSLSTHSPLELQAELTPKHRSWRWLIHIIAILLILFILVNMLRWIVRRSARKRARAQYTPTASAYVSEPPTGSGDSGPGNE